MHALILHAFLMVAPTPVAPRPAAAPIVDCPLTALRTLAAEGERLLRSGGSSVVRTSLPDEITNAIRNR